MATTSIWRVKGWLGKVVVYIENPEKTKNPAYFKKENMTDKQTQGMSDVIDYAVNPKKTQHMENNEIKKEFVSGVNCLPNTARDEMLAAKKRFGKDGGVVAYHGYQSFAPGEATPEIAHEIGIQLAKKLWGDRFQVLVATHLDKENHLHNHFVVNSVSFMDGKRYYRSEKDYYNMQMESDKLCREYGLSVIENPQKGKSKHYGEWRAEQEQRPTWRGFIKSDLDTAIRQSMTERQFFDTLKKMGYEIKMGKDISVRPQGKERFVRLIRNFGVDYSIENIRSRILAHNRPAKILPDKSKSLKYYAFKGSFKKAKKVKGFRALYLHYCYLLGVFPKNKPLSDKQLHFLLREDLLKLDNISKETRLLCENRIDTEDQLLSFKDTLEKQIDTLSKKRKQLYKKSRSKSVVNNKSELQETKKEITMITNQLKDLRKKVILCDDIAERSCVIINKINTIRKDKESKNNTIGKEERQHVQFR